MKLEMEAIVSQTPESARHAHAPLADARAPQARTFAPYSTRAANDANGAADAVTDETAVDIGDAQPAGTSSAPWFVTRSVRNLHRNFFASDAPQRDDEIIPAQDWTHLAAAVGIRTPMHAAAVLLGLYIAMYLAVAGVFHALASPDTAAAVASGHALTSLSVATAPGLDTGGESPATMLAALIDSSRECNAGHAIDSECIYN